MTSDAQLPTDPSNTVPTATCSVVIDAGTKQVWAVVGDIASLGAFSPETTKTEWVGDSSKPAVGSVFRGYNHLGGYDWATDCTILQYDVDRVFSFGVSWDDHDDFSSVWTYTLESISGGTKLSESFESAYLADPNRQTRSDREQALINGMEATLQAIKGAAEAG